MFISLKKIKNMKTITLSQAHKILEDCSAVITEDHVLLYPALSDLTGDPENEFMYLSYEDEGLAYYVKFAEFENKSIEVWGSSMFLHKTEGDIFQITVLVPQNLE